MSLVLGVIGHIDHGKTALVRALTGQDTDRLPEEKARGISIALGFAHFGAGAAGSVDLIDMPGHERFVRTMISGATGIDAVLLVVAANEGVRPQTVEHAQIAGLLGLRRALVVVSKCDLVETESAGRVACSARQLVEDCGMEALPAVLCSAATGAGIATLKAVLGGLAGEPKALGAGDAFLPIDRAFSIVGHGPVVTGTLRGGPLKVGDQMELMPDRRPCRVRSLQIHGRTQNAAAPGNRVAVNLRDLRSAELRRGMSLSRPGRLQLSEWLTIALRSVAGAPALRNGLPLTALFGTAEAETRLRLLDRDLLLPGEMALAQLRFARPVCLPARERVILRMPSPARTVAGGRVIEPVTARRRRHQQPALEYLRALDRLSPEGIVEAVALRFAAAGTSIGALSILSALSPETVADLLRRLPVVVDGKGAVVSRAHADGVARRVLPMLARAPAPLSLAALAERLPGAGTMALAAAAESLVTTGQAGRRGERYFLPQRDHARAAQEAALDRRIAATVLRDGLSPANAEALGEPAEVRPAINRLLAQGILIRAVDRDKQRTVLFHRDAVGEARRRLHDTLGQGDGLPVSQIGRALGISRKFSVPLLNYLDEAGFTRRIGDLRVLVESVGQSVASPNHGDAK